MWSPPYGDENGNSYWEPSDTANPHDLEHLCFGVEAFLEFFKSKGNEIIELAPEVQYEGREAGVKWAEGVAKENAYFKKVLDHQLKYFELWKDSSKYRNVKVR